jgi:hypothetical protein
MQRMASSVYFKVRDAILQNLQIVADYRGYRREFCPHAIGTKRGKEHVLGYQFGGASSSGLPPGGEWRCFDVAGLSNVGTRNGVWYTGNGHTQPQTCVDQIDVEVDH